MQTAFVEGGGAEQEVKGQPTMMPHLAHFLQHRLLGSLPPGVSEREQEDWCLLRDERQTRFAVSDPLAVRVVVAGRGTSAPPRRAGLSLDDLATFFRQLAGEQMLFPLADLVAAKCPLPGPRFADGTLHRPLPPHLTPELEWLDRATIQLTQTLRDNKRHVWQALKDGTLFAGVANKPYVAMACALLLKDQVLALASSERTPELLEAVDRSMRELALAHPELHINLDKAKLERMTKELDDATKKAPAPVASGEGKDEKRSLTGHKRPRSALSSSSSSSSSAAAARAAVGDEDELMQQRVDGLLAMKRLRTAIEHEQSELVLSASGNGPAPMEDDDEDAKATKAFYEEVDKANRAAGRV